MTATWKPLPWDSEFLGISIGRIEFDIVDTAEITACEQEAREHGVLCLYASLTPNDPTESYWLQSMGYRFLEAATLLNRDQDAPILPKPPGVTVRLGDVADLPAMQNLISHLTPWSRFAHDPRFGPDVADRLQNAWIERATRDVSGDHSLLLAETRGSIVAFLTRSRNPHPVIDTIGTTARGSGAARYLVEHSRAWGNGTPPLGGPIAASNVTALRFVDACDYRVKKVRYLYHRWLDEAPT